MAIRDVMAAAFDMLVRGDAQVVAAASTSVQVALLATGLATLFGVPLGFLAAARDFRGRRLLDLSLKTLTAFPTVVVGLLVYMLLSRSGPLGELGLLYTPTAMVLGEAVLITPLMAALTMTVVGGADPRIEETALTLGASSWRAALTVLAELRVGIVASVVTGFGRLISELGVALMVGGNIRGATRTMTTAIALETGKGEFAFAFALGLILLAIALSINLAVAVLGPSRA